MADRARRPLLHHPQRVLHHRLDRARPCGGSGERAPHGGGAYGFTLSQGQAATRVSPERLSPTGRRGLRRSAAEPMVRPGPVAGGAGELPRPERRPRARPGRLQGTGGGDSQPGDPPGPGGQREPLGQRPDLPAARAGPSRRGFRPQYAAAATARGRRRRGSRSGAGPRTGALRHPAAGPRRAGAGVHRVGAAGQSAELLRGPARLARRARRRRRAARMQRSRGWEAPPPRGRGGRC